MHVKRRFGMVAGLMEDDVTKTELSAENVREAQAGGDAWERILNANPDFGAAILNAPPRYRKLINRAFCLGWHASLLHRA